MKNCNVSSSFESKKVYAKPQVKIVQIDNTNIIATSNFGNDLDGDM